MVDFEKRRLHLLLGKIAQTLVEVRERITLGILKTALGPWLSGHRGFQHGYRDFLQLVGADTKAKYCWFRCGDDEGYTSPLDMATALHPQTQMTLKFDDKTLPVGYGFPMKIRVPTKLGFKNPKHIVALFISNEYPGGYWEDKGYNWFSGS